MASAVLLLATLFATWPNQVATESDNEPFGSQSGNRCVDDENRSQVRIFFLMIPKFRPLGISWLACILHFWSSIRHIAKKVI